MALGPGSIAFVGINTNGTDWFAFVAIDPIPAGQVIYFTDNELPTAASTQFNTGESYLKWTAPVGGVAAGTVVNFSALPANPGASNTSGTVSTGTFVAINNFGTSLNTGLSNGQDSLYAYTAASDATADTPTAHLAFVSIGTAADPAPQSLAANEQIAFTSGDDAAYYSGPHNNQTSFAGYLDEINNAANWTKVAAGTPDATLNATAYTITPPTETAGFAPGSVSVSHAEGDSAATTDFTFTIQRTGAVTGQLDFSGTVSPGTTDAADFAGGTLPTTFSGSMADGVSSATVTIHVSGDASFEADENFGLTLTNATDASATVNLGTTAATGTIQNDDFNIDLSNYVRVARYDLPEPTRTAPPDGTSLLAQEASAVTYDPDTDTLFVVGDGGTSVVQVSKTGQLIDSMTLAPGNSPQGTDFFDPEGLTYIGGGQFVMTEERDRNAVLFTYQAGTTLDRAHAETAHLGTFVGNIGLEGVTADPLSGGYIFVKEKDPESIFQTTIDFATDTASNGSASTDESTDLFNPASLNLLDIADVYALSNLPALNGQTDYSHLLVLSQESGKILETDRSGNILSTLTIHTDPGDTLDVVSQQHEGITMDRNGFLYTVAENGGGDIDHPQLWVYAPSSVPNAAPTAIALTNQVTSIAQNTSTASPIKVADIAVTDDGLGTNNFSVSGPDAAYFTADNTGLYIKAGTVLDFETKTSYAITVNVDDPTVGGSPDASTPYTLNVTDVANEGGGPTALYISEVAPWSSGNSPVTADWFEVTNSGSSAIDITGWKMDDNSDSFGSAVALQGITSIGAGESVIFIETGAGQTAGGNKTAFINDWFGGNAPAGLQIGSYGGSGVGLSTGGDHVNIFNNAGTLQASVAFGPSTAAPDFATFNNAAGLNNVTISTLSAAGTNGAFTVSQNLPQPHTETGSPGTVGKLFISEVAPWSSGSSPVGADWFEVTNTTAFAADITGWKMDDNSQSFAGAVSLQGITSIGAGESVIFIETSGVQTAAGNKAAFISDWFDGNAPAGLQIGSYGGSGVGLGTGGDAVNLYNGTGVLQASVNFGSSPGGPAFATFDNAAALNNATISTLSANGVDGAFTVSQNSPTVHTEIGSPGSIFSVVQPNQPPVAVDDPLTSIAEDSGDRTISLASLTANDSPGPASESGQTLTIISVANAVGGTVSINGSNVIFSPTPDYNGPASFDYTVQDNGTTNGANDFKTDVGSVSFTITPVNDAPTAVDDPLSSVAEDSGDRTISFASLLANDATGPANESGQSLTIVSAGNAVGGTVQIVGTNVLFSPTLNYNGPASFDYTVQDNGTTNGANDFRTDVGTVSFGITPVNDAPSITSSGTFSIAENHTAVGSVTATDPENDAVTFSINGGDDQAFFTIDPNTGALAFLGAPDFETPSDANHDNVYLVDVTASDQFSAASTQSISITVTDLVETGHIINGTSRNDALTGTVGDDTMNGASGADQVSGGDGNDNILGGAGNDTIAGEKGNDILNGGNGSDSIDGGLGNDFIAGGGGADHIDGGAGNNVLFGEESNDTVSAGDGNDYIDGGDGNDVLTAGDGDNTVFGGAGSDNLSVGAGNDILSGDDGNDTLDGGDGNDLLTGGNGKDVLTGGLGADVFVFGPPSAANADRITDFEAGNDKLQFTASDFGLPAGVLDAAHFVVGTKAVDHHAEFIYNAAAMKLQWDPDGVGGLGPIVVATFDTAVALMHSDLILV